MFPWTKSQIANIVDFRPESSRPSLRRPLSAVSVDGVMETTDGKVKRVKVLNTEQHKAISSLTCSSQLPHAERKRRFGALNRRLKHTNTLPAGVLAKWERATTPQQKPRAKIALTCASLFPDLIWHCIPQSGVSKNAWWLENAWLLRFEFLKCFMLDPDLNNVQVETWHKEPPPQTFNSLASSCWARPCCYLYIPTTKGSGVWKQSHICGDASGWIGVEVRQGLAPRTGCETPCPQIPFGVVFNFQLIFTFTFWRITCLPQCWVIFVGPNFLEDWDPQKYHNVEAFELNNPCPNLFSFDNFLTYEAKKGSLTPRTVLQPKHLHISICSMPLECTLAGPGQWAEETLQGVW